MTADDDDDCFCVFWTISAQMFSECRDDDVTPGGGVNVREEEVGVGMGVGWEGLFMFLSF